MNSEPKLLQIYLPDGTMEGAKIIELSGSSVKTFVVPRLKINQLKNRTELQQPAIYFLINSGEGQLYIGESENFFHRIKTHDQAKDFWDIAISVVSNTNNLEKSDVKYLESLAVEKAKETAAMEVLNKSIPTRNTVHEFKIHILHSILDDVALIAESLGYSFFSTAKDEKQTIWHAGAKLTDAKAQFRGDQFVVLAGSIIDKTHAPAFEKYYPQAVRLREEIFTRYGKDLGEVVELVQNAPLKSPNIAGGFVSGRNVNAWTFWKDAKGKTMDEVMRRGEK
jgi:hypothetical protein